MFLNLKVMQWLKTIFFLQKPICIVAIRFANFMRILRKTDIQKIQCQYNCMSKLLKITGKYSVLIYIISKNIFSTNFKIFQIKKNKSTVSKLEKKHI